MSSSPKLNILVAFPYFSNQIMRFLDSKDPDSFRLIVDSGAFTAWNTGKEVNFDAYCQFLKSLPKSWEYNAVQLDVYGDPEKTYVNYHRMLDLGFDKIMPVFTRGDTLERLEEFYTYTDYIMFGGIAIGGENRNYVKWFCEVNKGRKAHWLGFVNVPFLKHYKPYSVDSSSLYSGQRFGNLQYYSGAGQLKSVNRKEFHARPSQAVVQAIVKAGFSMQDVLNLAKQDSWEGGAQPPNSKSTRGLAAYITVTNHVRRAFEVEKNLGTKIYLALGNESQLQNVWDAAKQLKDHKLI